MAPVFSNVLASPAQVATGDAATITFTASEALRACEKMPAEENA
jgi:hypothetical protein